MANTKSTNTTLKLTPNDKLTINALISLQQCQKTAPNKYNWEQTSPFATIQYKNTYLNEKNNPQTNTVKIQRKNIKLIIINNVLNLIASSTLTKNPKNTDYAHANLELNLTSLIGKTQIAKIKQGKKTPIKMGISFQFDEQRTTLETKKIQTLPTCKRWWTDPSISTRTPKRAI